MKRHPRDRSEFTRLNPMSRNRPRREGFTLPETMVVIVVICVLMGLLGPALLSAREQANITACKTNMRSIMTAWESFERSRGYFPGGGAPHTIDGQEVGHFRTDSKRQPYAFSSEPQPALGKNQFSGPLDQLLPFLGEETLWREKELNTLNNALIDVYQCPSTDAVVGRSRYSFSVGHATLPQMLGTEAGPSQSEAGALKLGFRLDGNNNIIGDGRGHKLSAFDELAYSVVLTEQANIPDNNHRFYRARPATDSSGNVSRGANIISSQDGNPCFIELLVSCSLFQASTNHENVLLIATADGNVHTTNPVIDPDVWKAMNTIAGGESINITPEGSEFRNSQGTLSQTSVTTSGTVLARGD